MAGIAVKCSNCGALVTAADSKFCSFCGAMLALAPTADTVRVVTEIAINAPARFEAAERNPRLAELMEAKPDSSNTAGTVGKAVFLIVLVVIGLVAAAQSGSPVFLLVSVLAIVFLVAHFARESRISQAPFDRKLM